MSRRKGYDEAFVEMLRRADKAPPERYVRTLDELIEFLAEEDESQTIPNGEL